MKPISRSSLLAFILAFMSFIVVSCNKDDDKVKGENDYTSVSNLSKDEIAMEEATDESINDVAGLLAGNGGDNRSTQIVCNAVIDSTEVVNDTITYFITYNGLSCDGLRFRTGKVEVRKHIDTHFVLPGSVVNIRHINFSVTRVASGQTIVLNSNHTYTNITGGFAFMLGNFNLDTIVHQVEGSTQVTFEANNTRTWNIARKLTYTQLNGLYEVQVEGFGTSGEYTKLSNWGVNRNGEQFYTEINEPVIIKEACDWHPVSGVKIYRIPEVDKSAVVTFGYVLNQPVSGDECPTHFMVTWQNGTYSGVNFIPFP